MTTPIPLLARQPIYDGELNITAFELLFRSADSDSSAGFTDGDLATSDVIINAFTTLPVKDVLEGKPAYINFTRRLLDAPPPVEKSQLVVEILEDIVLDEQAIAAIKKLKQAGYTVALDDYVYNPTHRELLQLVDIVKLDVLAQDLDSVARQLSELKRFPVQLVAEKVETHDIFAACKAMGFDLFQGYFLAKPQIMKGQRSQPSQQTVLHLLTALQDPDITFGQVEAVIGTDPVLSYKVLRLVNSAQYHRGQQIESLARAVSLLGLNQVKNWASLMALGSLAAKPRALVMGTMVRSRMCQQLADASSDTRLQPDALFMVGLLSALDAYLDMPLTDILATLAVGPDTTAVLIDFAGPQGLLLKTAIAFEQADFDAIDWSALQTLELDKENVEQAYIDSIRWSADNAALLF